VKFPKTRSFLATYKKKSFKKIRTDENTIANLEFGLSASERPDPEV
jgi:hypothetical protein